MSSRTWTPAALSSEPSAASGRCWRLVEAQHLVSTAKLSDTRAEQERLTMIETQIDAMRNGADSIVITSNTLVSVQTARARINHLQQELLQARSLCYTYNHP